MVILLELMNEFWTCCLQILKYRSSLRWRIKAHSFSSIFSVSILTFKIYIQHNASLDISRCQLIILNNQDRSKKLILFVRVYMIATIYARWYIYELIMNWYEKNEIGGETLLCGNLTVHLFHLFLQQHFPSVHCPLLMLLMELSY